MDFFKTIKDNSGQIIKITLLVIIIFAAIAIIMRTLFGLNFFNTRNFLSTSHSMMGYDTMIESDEASLWGGAPEISTRNVLNAKGIAVGEPMLPYYDGTSGVDAENFEVSQYSAYVKTRYLTDTCQSIADLKVDTDIIFENSNEYEQGCSYTFKTTKEKETKVLELINALNPEELSENIYTIKNVIDDFTSREDILKKKLSSIESTLNDALSAYDEISQIARSNNNADALASVIDSKVRTIERLSQELINISAQLEQLGRNKADQLDRLEFTYFNIQITEDKYIDKDQISTSWKLAVQKFFKEFNFVLQDLTIGLITFTLFALMYAVYGFIVFLIAFFGWKVGKYFLKK